MYQLPDRHRARAERIPAKTRSALSDAELLARCSHAENLEKTVETISDRSTIYGYQALIAQVLEALPVADLERRCAELETLAAATSDAVLFRAQHARAAQLRTANPQPPADLTKAAEAEIRAARGPRTPSDWLYKGRRS